MKFTTFISQIVDKNKVEIPLEVLDKLDLKNGDKVELTLRKIKKSRLELLVSENPLHKLLKINE